LRVFQTEDGRRNLQGHVINQSYEKSLVGSFMCWLLTNLADLRLPT